MQNSKAGADVFRCAKNSNLLGSRRESGGFFKFGVGFWVSATKMGLTATKMSLTATKLRNRATKIKKWKIFQITVRFSIF
ncbi:hypothetical protein [Planococcus halotolerans]|uniref:Uncharacterized protein n=1 Tax=Planococcus halotolerans TaxID=2233542 RepID=A0A365L7U4_9BACL|nr:hypothetical protein [Planococcus halotolerans]RAZ81470.1 hypothetical protein DP120_04125 [Planococcus halotolerans]